MACTWIKILKLVQCMWVIYKSRRYNVDSTLVYEDNPNFHPTLSTFPKGHFLNLFNTIAKVTEWVSIHHFKLMASYSLVSQTWIRRDGSVVDILWPLLPTHILHCKHIVTQGICQIKVICYRLRNRPSFSLTHCSCMVIMKTC